MGINGLLPAFKGICRPSHIGKYRGQKLAVDGYSWLHKGAYCCSRELCECVWTDRCVCASRGARCAPLLDIPQARASARRACGWHGAVRLFPCRLACRIPGQMRRAARGSHLPGARPLC